MADVEWFYNDLELNRILVRRGPIKAETMFQANLIAAFGYVRLQAHHMNNADDPRPDSSVSVSRGTVDAFVNLDDPDGGAMAIAKFLGIFSPYAFNGTGARPKDGSPKKRKRLRKGYGRKK